MIAAVAALLLAGAPDCRFDRAAMVALPRRAFDQTMGQGWRELGDKGCEAAAADVIAAWRAAHPAEPQIFILVWHEGQMRAFAGDYAAARPLLIGGRQPNDGFGWNDYVAATIAFIDRDRPALLAARARLAATPRPETHPWFDPDGNPIPPPTLAPGRSWPDNLPVVDALIRCFNRSYKAAYESEDCFVR